MKTQAHVADRDAKAPRFSGSCTIAGMPRDAPAADPAPFGTQSLSVAQDVKRLVGAACGADLAARRPAEASDRNLGHSSCPPNPCRQTAPKTRAIRIVQADQ